MSGFSNWMTNQPFVRDMMNRFFGFAPQRSLPRYEYSLYSRHPIRTASKSTKPKVVLFGDCFVSYNEPRIGMAAIKVLEKLGYEVVLPDAGCCGRAMISMGLLADAIKTAEDTLAKLKPFIDDVNVKAILVAEPSCLASFKDDWLSLKLETDLSLRNKLSAKSMMIEDFVDQFWDAHPNQLSLKQSTGKPVLLHGHCHQKALWGDQTSSRLIKRIVGDKLTVIPQRLLRHGRVVWVYGASV